MQPGPGPGTRVVPASPTRVKETSTATGASKRHVRVALLTALLSARTHPCTEVQQEAAPSASSQAGGDKAVGDRS